jgi:HTH-type transcriptional regulator, cell division transcriptional repressor
MSDIELGIHKSKGITLLEAEDRDPSSLAARGNRLKRIRRLMGLTREDVRKKYGISDGTLRGWEDARLTGLTEKNVVRLLPVFEGECIQCSIGWLLHGEGTSPMVLNNKNLSERGGAQLDLTLALTKEINLFCEHHPHAVYLQVSDDGMEPYFRIGDYVAGERLYQQAIHKALGEQCIVETQMGEILVRSLRAGSKENHYTLQCLNSLTSHSAPTLYDIELLSAAPVIWHRRILSKSM